MASDLHAIYDLAWAAFAILLLAELRNWYAWLSRFPRLQEMRGPGAARNGGKA